MAIPSFLKTRKGVFICLCIVVVLGAIIGGIAGYYAHRSNYENSLENAKKPLIFPREYFAITRKFETTYKNMKFEDKNEKLLGDVLKCGSCFSKWTFYVLNTDEEIALKITRKPWSFKTEFYIEAQWPWEDIAFRNSSWKKIYSQKYTLEYDWSGSFGLDSIYHIYDGNNNKLGSTKRFRLEFGKTIEVENPSGTVIGKTTRPGFNIGNVKWTIDVEDDSKIPSYIFGTIAAITTLQEEEKNDK